MDIDRNFELDGHPERSEGPQRRLCLEEKFGAFPPPKRAAVALDLDLQP